MEFDCGNTRSIVYFLEVLLILAPFSKQAFKVTLTGITADDVDQSIDGVKNINLRILSYFGVSNGVDFKILKRGSSPNGGGRVFFTCPVVQMLNPVMLTDVGKIKKIRGVASTTRVSPQVANRLIEAARSQLNQFIPDIYIYSDVSKGEDSGNSPGYSLYLQAESTTGALLSADCTGCPGVTVEETAIKASNALLRQIQKGGFVSQSHQWMVLIMMAMCPEDLSKVMLGQMSDNCGSIMNDIKKFFGVSYKTVADATGGVMISCIGSGLVNLNRKTQ